MSNNDFKLSIKSQFRQAAHAVCQPKAEYQVEYHQPEVGNTIGNTSGNTSRNTAWNTTGNTKSSTQVESWVLPPNSGALKREGIPHGITRIRPSPLTIRLSEEHKNIIRMKAYVAGIPVNEFAKAALLGSDYKPPLSAELFTCLLDLHRELTRQGTNLNQIARQLNAGIIYHDKAYQLLAALAPELTKTYTAIYTVLANGRAGN
jgi:hypothetical protein